MQNEKASPEIAQRASDMLADPEAADVLGVKAATLPVWRSKGRYGIPFIKVGRLVRYRRGDLEKWLESRTRASGATE